MPLKNKSVKSASNIVIPIDTTIIIMSVNIIM